jgi:hypothetical protein
VPSSSTTTSSVPASPATPSAAMRSSAPALSEGRNRGEGERRDQQAQQNG